jgi:hypothetical protein
VLPLRGYALSTGYADAAGHTVTFNALLQACATYRDGSGTGVTTRCLAAKGFRLTQVYQPAGRYWPPQGIQTGVLAAAAVALLTLAVWWTTRRVS